MTVKTESPWVSCLHYVSNKFEREKSMTGERHPEGCQCNQCFERQMRHRDATAREVLEGEAKSLRSRLQGIETLLKSLPQELPREASRAIIELMRP
jgi:hypothetical protein